MISHRVHRVFIWIIGVLTIIGNALVLGGRNLAKTDNRILAMFVKNLAGIKRRRRESPHRAMKRRET